MRGLRNFIVGTISTLGVSQTLFASSISGHVPNELASVLNTVISIIGGILSTTVVAFLQHRWRMVEDERRFKREHSQSKAKQKSKSD